MYPLYTVDSGGQALDASKNSYSLRFAPGQLPPVNAFWSLTMYELPSILLTANPLNRYLINSPMLPDLKRDQDGGLTLYIQFESPGKDKESNWLPAPNGPFTVVMRLYWPKPEAVDGSWTAPPLEQTSPTPLQGEVGAHEEAASAGGPLSAATDTVGGVTDTVGGVTDTVGGVTDKLLGGEEKKR
jgi:hypothetical protein